LLGGLMDRGVSPELVVLSCRFQGSLAIAKYHIREIDDRLENFRLDG
jgi:hypothetical protein